MATGFEAVPGLRRPRASRRTRRRPDDAPQTRRGVRAGARGARRAQEDLALRRRPVRPRRAGAAAPAEAGLLRRRPLGLDDDRRSPGRARGSRGARPSRFRASGRPRRAISTPWSRCGSRCCASIRTTRSTAGCARTIDRARARAVRGAAPLAHRDDPPRRARRARSSASSAASSRSARRCSSRRATRTSRRRTCAPTRAAAACCARSSPRPSAGAARAGSTRCGCTTWPAATAAERAWEALGFAVVEQVRVARTICAGHADADHHRVAAVRLGRLGGGGARGACARLAALRQRRGGRGRAAARA